MHVSHYIDSYLYPQALWIPTPLVPGATDTIDNISEVGDWFGRNLPGQISRWELCSFNNLCKDKYTRLGMTWAFEDAELLSLEKIEKLVMVANSLLLITESCFETFHGRHPRGIGDPGIAFS
jgi:pyruvate formate lyase activating enzyme